MPPCVCVIEVKIRERTSVVCCIQVKNVVFMRKSSRGGAYGGETGEAKLVAKARDLREGVGVPWLEGEKLHV